MKYIIWLGALFVCIPTMSYAQSMITGKVINSSTREPVADASVMLLNSKNGTKTNRDGQFAVGVNIPDTLLVSHINFEPVRIPLASISKNAILVQLTESYNRENDVIVIGYGTTTKRFNTGSISKISDATIKTQPVTNPLAALQGRAPGVFVTTQNGLPGGNITVQIRGKNSIDAGNNPLYIIDGVPFISTPLNTGQSDLLFANDAISPLNSINPADIENIEILKDADATAIYGSRAANGVVLITTKKGIEGNTSLSVNFYQGISNISHFRSLLNLKQYLEIRNEAFKNDGVLPDEYSAPDLVVWDTTKSTNWQKYALGGTANISDAQTSISGGNDKTNFILSGNYRYETSILPGNQFYSKGGAHFNFNNKSFNNRFTLVFNANYTADKNILPAAMDGFSNLPPNFPLYNPDGTLNWTIYNNPIATLLQKTESKTTTLISNVVLGYKISDALNFKISTGYTKTELTQFMEKPIASLNSDWGESNGAIFGNNKFSATIIEPQLNYDKNIGLGKLSVVAGSSWQNSIREGTTINATNYSNESLFKSLSSAGNIAYITNNYSNYKYISFFGRINYNLLKKYVVNFNFRRDGSSRFGPGRQYGNFGAVGLAWLFTQEKFMQNLQSFINYGKLRFSYGIVGSDEIPDYQYMSAYRSSTLYGNTVTLYPQRIANPNFEWERTKKTEAGIELGILKDRIQLDVDWYYNLSNNQLVQYPLASQAGFTSYEYNLPALVKNTGWEFEIHTTNITRSHGLIWKTDFNLTIPKNELVSFPGIELTSYASRFTVGKSLDVYKGFKFLGVNPATGIAQFEDLNKDGQITQPDDFIAIGNQSPVLYGGLNNTFLYKRFQLNIFLQFTKQNGIMPSFAPGFDYFSNESPIVLKRWQKPGDITTVPLAATNYGTDAWFGNYNLSSSSAVFTNASYCRLKTVSFSYSIKPDLLKQLHIQNASVYAQGENLLLLANNKRIDPELLTFNGGIPPLRTYTIGFQITF